MRADAIAQFLTALGDELGAETVAAAFALHLAPITVNALPAQVQPHWRDVARLLKSPADRPISEKAIAAVRSWPTARVGELVAVLQAADGILEALENERQEDEIRDKIRRHYL